MSRRKHEPPVWPGGSDWVAINHTRDLLTDLLREAGWHPGGGPAGWWTPDDRQVDGSEALVFAVRLAAMLPDVFTDPFINEG